MTLREKIEVMKAFERGEEIECKYSGSLDWFTVTAKNPEFRWDGDNYRIKPKPKQIVVIEKWLFEDKFGIKFVQEIEKDCVLCYCNEFNTQKVKLLDTYEVVL